MRLVLSAWVPGNPKTKGSMSSRGNGTMYENVAGSSRWRLLMAAKFREVLGVMGPPVAPDRGARVDSLYYLARPAGDVSEYPIEGRKGDSDKLDRNLNDALTDAGAWRDDEQKIDGRTQKLWAPDGGRGPGVWVVVFEIQPGEGPYQGVL